MRLPPFGQSRWCPACCRGYHDHDSSFVSQKRRRKDTLEDGDNSQPIFHHKDPSEGTQFTQQSRGLPIDTAFPRVRILRSLRYEIAEDGTGLVCADLPEVE